MKFLNNLKSHLKDIGNYQNIALLLCCGFILRIILANFGTLTLDFNTFVSWSDRLVAVGFAGFYNAWSDYLPGYLYVLWMLAKLKQILPPFLVDTTMLYKLPAIFADVITSFLIYKIVLKTKNEKWALIASSLYLFNPAIFANSSLWGQVDSLTALFAVLTIYFANTNWILSAVSLAIGTFIKPQEAFVAIVVLWIMQKNKWKIGKIAGFIAIAAAVFILGFVPFSLGKPLFPFILERLLVTNNQYPYTSVNAFNFWGVVGFWKKDNIGLIPSQALGWFLSLVLIAIPLFKFKHQKETEKSLFDYRLLSIVLLSSFVFLTRMHERHLLPALAPLVIAIVDSPTLIVSYIVLSVIYLANLRYAYVWIMEDFRSVFPNELLSIFSLTSVLAFVSVVFPLPKNLFKIFDGLNKFDFQKDVHFDFSQVKIPKEYYKAILLLILAFALLTRVLFLGSPTKEYFDEVYHAFTARVMLHNDPKAWEWWNTPPEGFAYEWTHPPFAKLAMWGSMALLGESSLAWRLPGAIAGTLIILMVYLLSKEIFDDELVSLLVAAVLALDGLALVMSRIGMNDSYFLVFALTSIYFFIKEKPLLKFTKDNYFLSAIFLGLAAASKWTTMWVLPILLVALIVFKVKEVKKLNFLKLSLVWFLILVPLIYLANYIPMFLTHHSWGEFIEVQKQMWWYHTNLRATHAYSSNPLSWPFLIRPIWLYTSGAANGLIANIYAFGNPIVFWVGLVSVFATTYYAIVEKNKKLAFVVFSYFALFLPWAFSPRIMFLYHYLPAVPFLAIATGYVLRRFPKNIITFFVIAFIVFVYFYPHYTGIKVPVWLDNSYYWFDSWR